MQDHLTEQIAWDDKEVSIRLHSMEEGLFHEINGFKCAQNEMLLHFIEKVEQLRYSQFEISGSVNISITDEQYW